MEPTPPPPPLTVIKKSRAIEIVITWKSKIRAKSATAEKQIDFCEFHLRVNPATQ